MFRRHTLIPSHHRKAASVLVGVLWCVVLLSAVVLGILHTSSIDLMAGHYQTDQIQARYLALAGIEKAKALLHQSELDRRRAGVPFTAELFNAPASFRDVHLGRGTFRVVRPPRDEESGNLVYGVSDEEGRLNANVADASEIGKIVGMTPDVAAAIVDWRDSDNTVTPGGAEIDYYASLNPPYRPRNAPFETIRELLMVRGIRSDLLLGTPEPSSPTTESVDAAGSPPTVGSSAPDFKAETLTEGGWAALLTVHSSSENLDASGLARVNVQTADEATLTGVHGITPEIARAIMAHRQRNTLRSITDLLDVPPAAPGNNSNRAIVSGGQKVVDERLLKELADHLTTEEEAESEGTVNLNTAGVEVLQCLPGMTRALAQAIVSHRNANGFYTSPMGLLDVPGFSQTLIQQLYPRVCVRSNTYRIRAEGRTGKSRQVLEAVVRIRARTVTTLAYREDDL